MTSNYRSTSGEGTAFENRYGAFVLAHLLAGKGMAALYRAVPQMLFFQAWDQSKVDDLVIDAADAKGRKIRALVASRIHPRLIPSDGDSIPLFTNFLAEYAKNPKGMRTGSHILVLVAESTCQDAAQLLKLTSYARHHDNESLFVNAAANWSTKIKNRLNYVSRLITVAGKNVPGHPSPFELIRAMVVDLHQWILPSHGVVRAQEALDEYVDANAPGQRLDFDHLVTLSADLSHHGGTVTRASLIERLITDGLISTPASSPNVATGLKATLAKHITKLYAASRKVTDGGLFVPATDNIYNLMKDDRLHLLLKDLPSNLAALSAAQRVLSHYEETVLVSDLAETVIAEASILRDQLNDLRRDYLAYAEDRKWRHSYDLESVEAEMVVLRADGIERDLPIVTLTLSRMYQASVALRDAIELCHPEETVLDGSEG